VADGTGFTSVNQHVLGQDVREWRAQPARTTESIPAVGPVPQFDIQTQMTRPPTAAPQASLEMTRPPGAAEDL